MDAYRQLRAEEIIKTLERLRARIDERFPEAGLGRVAEQVLAVARENAKQAQRLKRSNPILRATIFGVLGLTGAWLLYLASSVATGKFDWTVKSGAELIQEIEAALGIVVFLGAAIVFLVTLDVRWKRGRALRAIHELRSLAHIVDMHQLTKEPDRVLHRLAPTPSSPSRVTSPFLLGRYLDYCAELLALIAKIGALYAESLDDAVAIAAVDEVEELTTGLSNKIWQKLIVLDRIAGSSERSADFGARD